MSAQIPYPPVFHDWRPDNNRRVATTRGVGGVIVEMLLPGSHPPAWLQVELTEDDACLLAASLLERADRKKLARKVLEKL